MHENDLRVQMQVGFMIQAESDPQRRDEYLQKLMELPNQVDYQLCLRQWNGFARIVGLYIM